MKKYNVAPKGNILNIQAYVPGEAKSTQKNPIRLASNENSYGPSPTSQEAFIKVASELHRYPDGGSLELREELAKKYSLNADNIVCGTGSDELINLLTIAYAGHGDEVLYSQYGFLMYPIAANIVGATPVKADEPDRQTSVNELLGSVTTKTRIVFVANPNNPTGFMLTKDEIVRLRTNLRDDILLVLDGAYAEYVIDQDYTAGAELVEEYGNIVMLRTFSKLFALSSLRVGWAYCSPDVAENLNRIRGVFNVNLAAQKASVAALKDDAHIQNSIENNIHVREKVTDQLSELGLKVYPSKANFILVSFGTAKNADDCDEYLRKNNILVRKTASYDLPDCLRITIGTENEMIVVVEKIKDFLNRE